MTTMTRNNTTSTTPRVYVACLSCYNGGRLIGNWYDAAGVDTVTIDALHADDMSVARVDCEEMWCFDVDGLPLSRECSPVEAAQWGQFIADVDDWERDAVLAWVRSGDYVAEGTGNLPSLSDFEERYAGEFGSFQDYAENMADDIGLLDGMPDDLRGYFNWSPWGRDLAYDFTTTDAPNGGVFVFRNL